MIQTPKTITIVLAANAFKHVPIAGRYLTILSCNVASFDVAFDDDAYSTFFPGIGYPAAGQGFQFLRFRDALGAGCTIVATVSSAPLPIQDARYGAAAVVMVGMAANVARLAPGLIGTTTPLTVIAQTGVATTQIITAGVDNKRLLLQADHDNAGEVYLGFTNAVTVATCFARLLPGENWVENFAGSIWACSENGTEGMRGYVTS